MSSARKLLPAFGSEPQLSLCCRLDHFVNGMDIVPRLLGNSISLSKLRPMLEKVLPKLLPVMAQIETQRVSFRPCGMYHLFVKGQLQSANSTAQPDLLALGLGQIFEHLCTAWGTSKLPFIEPHLEYEHSFQCAFDQAHATLCSTGTSHLGVAFASPPGLILSIEHRPV